VKLRLHPGLERRSLPKPSSTVFQNMAYIIWQQLRMIPEWSCLGVYRFEHLKLFSMDAARYDQSGDIMFRQPVCGVKDHDVMAITMNRAIQMMKDMDLYVFF